MKNCPLPNKRASITGRLLIGTLLVIAFASIARADSSAPAPPAPATADDVLNFLNEMIDWYRRIAVFDQTPINIQEVVFRDSVRQNARKVLQDAFDFATAEAALLGTADQTASAPSAQAASRARIAQSLAAAAKRIAEAQVELERIQRQIPQAPTDTLAVLNARKDKLNSEINLLNTRRQVLQKYTGFLNDASGSLTQRVQDLLHSVPDLQPPSTASNDKSTAAPLSSVSSAPAQQQVFQPESTGVLGLVSDMFTFSQRMVETSSLAEDVTKLKQLNEKLRLPLRTQLQEALRRGEKLSQTQESETVDALTAERQQIDALTNRFTQLTGAAVPLGQQNVLLDATQTSLNQWHAAIGHEYGRAIRALVIRLGSIGVAILILLGISQIWRRATFRYVRDPRRRRQFLLVRRLVVGCIIIIIVIAGVVTEFGSLATFAGLITAGIAVALQTVIVSGVAYFFFIGRYGVRVGDRVTISGVTGDVIDIGLFRLYLMELGGTGRDLHPTGRIVVFANSVLFQPSAFFKQIPGAEYAWHEISLTLSPDSDHELAESKLLEAVESIYSEYRERVERQHSHIVETMHLQLPAPEPQGRLRLVDSGLEFTVRYPVEMRRAVEIDDRITRRLLETIEAEPKLKLVSSGTPRIQPAEAML